LYRAGNGVKQDYNQAVRWFRLSADQGYAAAQNELASMERAIAGANRPAPVSVPEIEDVPAQAETVPTESIKEPSQIPTMAKSEPEPETIESPVPDTSEVDTEVEEKPKRSFFSKLFGKKDVVDPEPEPVPVETEVVVIDEPETIASPAPDASEPDISGTATEEDEPKRGFFSRLFGKKDAVDPEPEQDGVVYATPEEVAAVEEVSAPETIEAPAPDTNEPEIIGVVYEIDEAPNEGFFTRLFVKKDTVPEDLTEQSIDESSEVMTYAADSAPAGQQLESSTEVEITVAQLDPVETATQLPAEVALPEAELAVEDETDTKTEIIIEETPEDKTEKKGFFSRLFGGKKSDDAEEIISEEVVEIDSPEEPIIIAKLEEPEEDAPIEEESTEVLIESIDVTPDAINTGAASDIQPLAVKGDSTAQFQLGTLYYQGKGVKQDYSQAFLWYRRAAQQDNSDAQYSLGNMYLMGEGIEQDDYQARQWYEKAAEQGHESAQHNLENLQRIAAAEPEYDTNDNNR